MTEFEIRGVRYQVPQLTLGDYAEIERVTGQGYNLDEGGALGLLALAYVAVKRIRPEVTLRELQDLGPDEITFVEDEPVEEVPPPLLEGSSEKPEPSSASSYTALGDFPDATPVSSGTSSSDQGAKAA